ncbi:MAG TPA: CehA/McbA family metallohydrolase [Kofleriaceae bacterium]|nr:CehA/McbA family metallohydrolase [Kofleriaceae bacterium]
MRRVRPRRIIVGALLAGAVLIVSAAALRHLPRAAPPAPDAPPDAPPDAAPDPAPDAPPPPPVSTTTLVVRVTDRGVPVGARVLLLAGDGPLRIGSLDLYGTRQTTTACELAPGVVGSWNGLILARGAAAIPIGADACAPSPAIPYGRYRVRAWRGIEYELWEGEVDLSADRGPVELAIRLERAWTPHGALAADLHVHALASADSGLPDRQRVIAQVAAGIQVVALADHNASGDLGPEIAALGLEAALASIPSSELSADQAHVGVYPVAVVPGAPRGGSPSDGELAEAGPEALLAAARRLARDPAASIVQINHPRLRWAGLFDAAAWDGRAWPPPFPPGFDAIEVVAGHTAFNAAGDRRLDESRRDFETLVDRGRPLAPLGNSDAHDLNSILDGAARSYVFVDRPATAPFDEAGFVAAIRARRTVATSGPWLDVEVAPARGRPTAGPGGSIRARGAAWVDVTVEQTRFVRTRRLRIAVGGRPPRTIAIPPGVRRFRWTGAVQIGPADTWIGVSADGDAPLPAEVTGDLHQEAGRPGVTPFALASPILVDADGDGRWRRGDANLALPSEPD